VGSENGEEVTVNTSAALLLNELREMRETKATRLAQLMMSSRSLDRLIKASNPSNVALEHEAERR
jgi:hypothetical protein